MRASTVIPAALAATVLAACTGPAVVTTEEAGPATSATPTAAPPPPLNTTNLVNAFDFGVPTDGFTRYFFTTPSGRWQCAIVPRVHAGCQNARGAALGIEGAPETVTDADGQQSAPTALLVGRDGAPEFVALPDAPLTPADATAAVLRFNEVLAVAGFRCNVQESSGVSCLSERSGQGFTFSAEGWAPHYTEVPAGAFIAPPTSTTG